MLTRLSVNCMQEATAYNKSELLHKKMMSLCCSSIPSHKDGQALLKKFPVFYSLIGHLREEQTIEDGIILKGTRIVIPAKKWEAVLKQLMISLRN